jgi:hypothetical protein
MHTAYIFPSEHGHRTGARELAISDASGNTLFITPGTLPSRLIAWLTLLPSADPLAHAPIDAPWLSSC